MHGQSISGMESTGDRCRGGLSPCSTGYPMRRLIVDEVSNMTRFHLHLVSDATGETLVSLAKAALVQFENAEPTHHLWSMVRSRKQMEDALAAISSQPGLVMFTLVDHTLREMLQERCRELQMPCVPVLDPVLAALANFLGSESREQPGRQHAMNAEYFTRIDAMHYCMSHDDGHGVTDLNGADVILVGVSRTSKTPTCIYLANRGIKAANVPIVPGIPLPAELEHMPDKLVVGLTASPDRLVQIRRNRLLQLKQDGETDYVDIDIVKDEVAHARKVFSQRGWPVIDVTRRSIEETAAAIINLHSRARGV